MEKRISEVKNVNCNVCNCTYNDGNCNCMAGSINVGTASASNAQDTCCATFKHK